MARFVMVLVTVVTLMGVVSAQQAPDPLLARLAGSWSGEGTVLNQPARVEAEWAWTLGSRFLRLTFRNTMGVAPKTQVFEGHAYYRALGEGRYRGTWVDNSGAIRPIEAKRDGDAIVAQWGTPDTEVGETTYRLLSDNRMEIIDRVRQKDGTWRDFGKTTVSKK